MRGRAAPGYSRVRRAATAREATPAELAPPVRGPFEQPRVERFDGVESESRSRERSRRCGCDHHRFTPFGSLSAASAVLLIRPFQKYPVPWDLERFAPAPIVCAPSVTLCGARAETGLRAEELVGCVQALRAHLQRRMSGQRAGSCRDVRQPLAARYAGGHAGNMERWDVSRTPDGAGYAAPFGGAPQLAQDHTPSRGPVP